MSSRQRFWSWCAALLGLFAFCWLGDFPAGDELQQFPRAWHAVDPDYLPHDLFVASAQADHWMFFKLLGALFWIAGPVGGPLVARWAIWLTTAASLVFLGRSAGLRSAPIALGVLIFIAYGQEPLGGETLIGEAIAKHLGYPLVFFALACWVRGRFLASAALLGAATSLHILVGFWAAVTMLCVLPFDDRLRVRPWPTLALAAALFLLCASPGLWGAVELAQEYRSAGAAAADEIFVFFRHPHHLDPRSWPLSHYLHFLVVIVLFLASFALLKSTTEMRRLRLFTISAAAITIFSLAVGLTWQNLFFLKLHPYRFGPPFLALITSLLAAEWMLRLRPVLLRTVTCGVVAAAGLCFVPRGLYHSVQRKVSGMPTTEAARRDALQWLQSCTPLDATVLADPSWADLQWRARRSAVVSFKLFPFRPSDILEWRRRLAIASGAGELAPAPGHIQTQNVHAAYEQVDTASLLASAKQLPADFAIARTPCEDSSTLAYSNSDFCIYALGEFAGCPAKYLVVRYDDYAPMGPYDNTPRNPEIEERLFELAAKYNAKLSVGVIPFPTSSPDTPIQDSFSATPDESWLTQTDHPWVRLLRRYIELGIVEPALHGFEHRVRTPTGHRPGEFRHQSGQWQHDAVRRGRDLLAATLQSPIDAFIPPWNAWDPQTAQALANSNFTWLSPDLHHADGGRMSINVVPQSTADPKKALSWMREMKTPGTVIVLVTHPFDFEGHNGPLYFSGLEQVFRFAASDPEWKSVGFTQLPSAALEEWSARFRAGVKWDHARALLTDVPGLTGMLEAWSVPYQPYDWYSNHQWRPRLAFVALSSLTVAAGVALSAVLAGLVLKSPASTGVAAVIAAVAVSVLLLGAARIVQNDYAVRGIRWLAMGVAAGLAAGWGLVTIRRASAASRTDRKVVGVPEKNGRAVITA